MSSEPDELAVLDRVEDGARAVLLVGERESERVVPVASLPAAAKPGTWLRVRFSGDELVAVTIDAQETERVRQRVREKMERLRTRGRKLP